MRNDLYKKYVCTHCGTERDIMVNHDGLPELFDRCTEDCMWSNEGFKGPVIYSENGIETGFNKRLFKRKVSNA